MRYTSLCLVKRVLACLVFYLKSVERTRGDLNAGRGRRAWSCWVLKKKRCRIRVFCFVFPYENVIPVPDVAIRHPRHFILLLVFTLLIIPLPLELQRMMMLSFLSHRLLCYNPVCFLSLVFFFPCCFVKTSSSRFLQDKVCFQCFHLADFWERTSWVRAVRWCFILFFICKQVAETENVKLSR